MLGELPDPEPDLVGFGNEGPTFPDDDDCCPPLVGLDEPDEGAEEDEDGEPGMGLGRPLGKELDVVVRHPAVSTEPASTSNALDQPE